MYRPLAVGEDLWLSWRHSPTGPLVGINVTGYRIHLLIEIDIIGLWTLTVKDENEVEGAHEQAEEVGRGNTIM